MGIPKRKDDVLFLKELELLSLMTSNPQIRNKEEPEKEENRTFDNTCNVEEPLPIIFGCILLYL